MKKVSKNEWSHNSVLCTEGRIDTAYFPHEPRLLDGLIHNDHLATPQKMTSSNGTVVWSADYKPFGEATITVSTITNNLRFPGQYFDAETGLNYNYFRDYNPIIGRYVERDPVGLKGGINLYAYVRSNPILFVDLLGLRPLTDAEKNVLQPYIPQTDLNNADVHVGDMPWYTPDWAAGITRGNDIYIRDPNFTSASPEGMSLLGHELVHVGQYRDGMTGLSYLWEGLWNGYDNNRYEVPAYDTGRQILNDLRDRYGDRFPCRN